MEFGLPSLRTGLADFPHPALRLMVLPLRGLTDQDMGRCQVEQPLLGKVGIRPAVMVRSSSSSTASLSFAEDTPQTHTDPAVECGEGAAVAVLEVFKPATQRAVDIGHDHAQ